MAAHTCAVAKHATLTTTTADSVSFTTAPKKVTVINRDSVEPLYFTAQLSIEAPTAAEDDSWIVPPGGFVTVPAPGHGTVVNVVGNGNAYTVEAVPL